MPAINSKRKNRLLSYIYICIFIVAIIVFIVVGSIVIKESRQNAKLNEIKSQLIDEQKRYELGEEDKEEDCYTVYIKDEYALIDGDIYIYNK